KRRGFPLIHVRMDYELEGLREHARESDLTLVIPRAAFEELRREFGGKVRLIAQLSCIEGSPLEAGNGLPEPRDLLGIPRPRLGYLGSLAGRVSITLLKETLRQHPEWQFLSFDTRKSLSLPNAHVLAWRSQKNLTGILSGLDVGFMPYDCSIAKNLHCVP